LRKKPKGEVGRIITEREVRVVLSLRRVCVGAVITIHPFGSQIQTASSTAEDVFAAAANAEQWRRRRHPGERGFLDSRR